MFFHITIHPAHRRFLPFILGTDHYQYKVLPFGLSAAPRVFSKFLVVVVAALCKEGVINFPYLDNCLLKVLSETDVLCTVRMTMHFFLSLSLCINLEKSTITLVRHLKFFRTQMDVIQARAFLPAHRFLTIVDLISTIRVCSQSSARTCLQLLSHMAVASFIVKCAYLHMWCLRAWLKKNLTQTQPAQTPIHAHDGQGLTTVVDPSQEWLYWGSFPFSSIAHNFNNRRFLDQLGSGTLQTYSPGQVVSYLIYPAHQIHD